MLLYKIFNLLFFLQQHYIVFIFLKHCTFTKNIFHLLFLRERLNFFKPNFKVGSMLSNGGKISPQSLYHGIVCFQNSENLFHTVSIHYCLQQYSKLQQTSWILPYPGISLLSTVSIFWCLVVMLDVPVWLAARVPFPPGAIIKHVTTVSLLSFACQFSFKNKVAADISYAKTLAAEHWHNSSS